MDEGRRSGDPSGSGFMVKDRSSSGCLIVRKKAKDNNDGIGGVDGSRKFLGSKKRARFDVSDSGSSDELLMPPRTRVGPETIRVCNGLSLFDKGGVDLEENDVSRKRGREDVTPGRSSHEVDANVVGRNAGKGGLSERKRNHLDVFEFDEYEGNDVEMMMQRRRKRFDDGGIDTRGRLIRSMMTGRSGIDRECQTSSSRHPGIDRRKVSYLEKSSGFKRGDHGDMTGTSFYADKYDSDEPIRVQGKNGVLKVMVNKKKKMDGMELEEKRRSLRLEDTVKRNVSRLPPYSESKSAERTSSVGGTHKSPMNILRSSLGKNSSGTNGKVGHHDSVDSEKSLKLGLNKVDVHNFSKTPLSDKSLGKHEVDSEDSDTSLKLGHKNEEAYKSMKGASSVAEITMSNQLLPTRTKAGKVKRGTGTEKQKLREQIRKMLLDSGWTIDYRPRRNRDYLDAVYINPAGTAYWSIIKAYDALLKQLNDEEEEAKSKGDPFTPLSDEALSQLTRKTRKKMEKEMKMKKKQRDVGESENARETAARKSSSSRHDEQSMDNGSHEEKLSSFIKQGGKSLKSRLSGNFNLDTKERSSSHHLHDGMEQTSSGSNSHQGRKSRKLGRCTLLVRHSNEGQNSESDGFVPYTGRRTLLSWLIDCGVVQLSQKVRYMNRRRTKVMLEGWVTRDGIHCGCCSKILTVLKFEIHAGSKLRQPFQNIFLDSGVSLLECQIDAWNRQEFIERADFHSVDIDGDDPDDDTCGICGDGGNLICCDGCPSTFHQNCLGIKMLPPGDWRCPNCICKICGIAGETSDLEDDTTVAEPLTCSLCMKKYHKSCLHEVDALSVDSTDLIRCFCGKACRELFEQLQKFLGVKHELESGFSWSLIHRVDVDLDMSSLGLPQKVECNSKLAVSLSVMDECFLPIVDRRSGINIIQNVLYNCGSNFSRLNFRGFYAAILERGDEIISVASIRFHGTQLAEMPFIGTRHVYRRQGMCRRLFSAIESALTSLKVQKLVIPAISELTHTWTGVFGFTSLTDSLKQELKFMNMLVFPGIDMLQKQLLEKENIDGNRITRTCLKGSELEDSRCITPEVATKSDNDSSALHDLNEYDDGGSKHGGGTCDEMVTTSSDSQCIGVPVNGTSVIGSPLDSSHKLQDSALLGETVNADFDSGHKLDGSAVEKKSLCVPDTNHELLKTDIKAVPDSPAEDDSKSCTRGVMSKSDSPCIGVSSNDASAKNCSLDAPNKLKNVLLLEESMCVDSESEDKLDELNSDSKCLIKTEMASAVKGEIQEARALNLNESASDEIKVSISLEEGKPLDCQSGAVYHWKHHVDSDADHNAEEMETKHLAGYRTENNSNYVDSDGGCGAIEMETDIDRDYLVRSQTSKEDSHLQNGEVACSKAVLSAEGATDDKSMQEVDEFPSVPDAVPSTEGATDDIYSYKMDGCSSVSKAAPSVKGATCVEAVPSTDEANGDKYIRKMGEFPGALGALPCTDGAIDDKSTQQKDEFSSLPVSICSNDEQSSVEINLKDTL